MFAQLNNGEPVRALNFTPDELSIVRQLPLISAKPIVYACNIDADSVMLGTNDLAERFKKHVAAKYPNTPVVTLSALLESDIVQIRNEEGEE